MAIGNIWRHLDRAWFPVLPLTSCVTLDKFPYLAKPYSLFICKMGVIMGHLSNDCCMKWDKVHRISSTEEACNNYLLILIPVQQTVICVFGLWAAAAWSPPTRDRVRCYQRHWDVLSALGPHCLLSSHQFGIVQMFRFLEMPEANSPDSKFEPWRCSSLFLE